MSYKLQIEFCPLCSCKLNHEKYEYVVIGTQHRVNCEHCYNFLLWFDDDQLTLLQYYFSGNYLSGKGIIADLYCERTEIIIENDRIKLNKFLIPDKIDKDSLILFYDKIFNLIVFT